MQKILAILEEQWNKLILTEEIEQKLEKIPNQLNELGYDNWGMHPKTIKHFLGILRLFFEYYFRVEVQGIENVPANRVLVIANHGGQLPLDGALLYYTMATKANPPRILRGMIDRFIPQLPFIGTLMARCGHVSGEPLNCQKLLENEEAVLVFPEGTKGSGKLFWQRYQLQKFGTGFMRMALETNSPILPVALVGTEETYPAIYNFKTMAHLLQLPYFPITPTWPLLGPLGIIPIPVKIRIYIGNPMKFEGDFDGPEAAIQRQVDMVSHRIQEMINHGLKERGVHYF